jgi:4-amino-4-deoxy-L-arabinose transferase-like glycosyltransferase
MTARVENRQRSAAGPSRVVRPVLPTSRRGWLFCGGILLLALLVRIAVVLVTRHGYRPLNDAASFDIIANSIAHGHGYGKTLIVPASGPSSYRDPVYPAVLAVFYAVFGHSWTVGRLQEALIGTGLVGMIGLVASQLWSRRVGAVALAVAAIHPTLILYGSGLQLEPLLALLTLGTLAAALEHRRQPRGLLWPVVCGLLLGLALLTRELAIAVVPAVVWLLAVPPGWSWRRRSVDKAALAAPALFVGVVLLCLVPWTVRNEVRLHALVPTSTSTGYTLAGTYNTTSMHDKQWPALWIPPYYDPTLAKILLSRPHPSEAWTNTVMRSAAVRFVGAHPTYVLTVAYWNTVRLFDLDGTKAALFDAAYLPYPRRLTQAAVYASYLLEALALVALCMRRTWSAPKVVWLTPVFAFVPIVLLSGFIRYRASIEPFTVLLASFAVTVGLERLGLFSARADG